MSNQDKFAEKLHDKGKAEEDLYFAKQDAEKLQHLHEEVSAEHPAKNACPKCGTQLAEQKLDGVTIDTCRTCEGIWLDRGELELLVTRESESWFSGWVRSLLDQAK